MFEFQLPADPVAKATMILCVKVSLLLGVAWLTHWLLRHQHAAWRILLWRLSAVGIVTLLITCHRTPWIQLALHQPTATVTQSQEAGAFSAIPPVMDTAASTDPWASDFEPTHEQSHSPSLGPSANSVTTEPRLPAPMPTGNTQFAPVVRRESWR
ncbi:MAG: hypothetical protein KDA87_09015, partial [Planctomycetales bacterium]|nr:hypothetical protein [Planctomycetales bacterium]